MKPLTQVLAENGHEPPFVLAVPGIVLASDVAWPYAAGSVVLIDDVRMMGREGWPSVRGLLERAYVRPGLWDLELADDIVRLTPISPESGMAPAS